MSYEEVQEEQVDNSHLVFDSSKHSAELIMMGSPSKDKEQKDSPSTEDQRNGIYELQGPTELPTKDTQPTQGPESNPRGCTDESVLEQYARTKLFPTQLPSTPQPGSTPFSQYIDLQAGECIEPASTPNVRDLDPMVFTTTQELEANILKAAEARKEEQKGRLLKGKKGREETVTTQELEANILKAEEARQEEQKRRLLKEEKDRKEALKNSYLGLRQDDAQAMDVELFQQIRGIRLPVEAPILTRSEILAMKTVHLRELMKTYHYTFLNTQGKEDSKSVSRNTNKQANGEGGIALLRKRVVSFNYWRYCKTVGTLPDTWLRLSGGVAEYTPNEFVRLVIAYTDANHRELLLLTAQKASREELDCADGNPGTQAHGIINKAYNNFNGYRPVNDYNDEDGELGNLDPNDSTIRVRAPSNTKSVWSSLKSAFYLCHKDWKRSGQMDPEEFPNFSKDKWHLLYLWKKFHKSPEMINMITRSLHPDAIVDSMDQTNENIADRAQLVMQKSCRRNARAPVASIRVPPAATPSTISMFTEQKEQKKDPALLWLDTISNNLMQVFKENKNDGKRKRKKKRHGDSLGLSTVRRELASLRKDRRDCWVLVRQLDKEVLTSVGPCRENIKRMIASEKESIQVIEDDMRELEERVGKPQKKTKVNPGYNKSKKKDHNDIISVDDESDDEKSEDDESEDDESEDGKSEDKKSEGEDDEQSEEEVNKSDGNDDNKGDEEDNKREENKKSDEENKDKSVIGLAEDDFNGKTEDEMARIREHMRRVVFAEVPALGKIYRWVQDNGHLFTRTPVGPIAVEIDARSQDDAEWLRSHVANNTAMKSFIVRSKQDYDVLYHHIREIQRIPVYIIIHDDDFSGIDDPATLVSDTLMSQVDDSEGYDIRALLLHFQDDLDFRMPSEDSDDDNEPVGLDLKKHN
jgi:hypothetical protein